MKNDLVVVVPAAHMKQNVFMFFFVSKRRYLSLVTHFSVLINHLSVQQTMLMDNWRNYIENG